MNDEYRFWSERLLDLLAEADTDYKRYLMHEAIVECYTKMIQILEENK